MLLLLLILGCGDWGWEPVPNDDFEPMLNVMAILSPDQGGVTGVEVMRTFPLDGPDYIWGPVDTVWWNDTLWWPERRMIYTGHVADASVILSDASNDYALVYDSSSRYEPAGRYLPVDTAFVPQPGRRYDLLVTTPDGLEVTGSNTIPQWEGLIEEHTPDTLYATKTIPMAWRKGTGFYLLQFEPTDERYWIYIPNRVVVDDTTYLNPPPYQDGDLEGWEDWSVQEISVATVDSNYYRYFITKPHEAGDFTSFFLGEGDTGAAYGIQGGLGVFCSYRI